jgi:hypothetical protein
MDAKSGNGGNRGGCPTMAASLLLLGLAVTAGAETRTLPQSWMTVASNPLATATVERTLYERPNDPHFYIRVRITNTTDRPLGVDLRDCWRVIYPNQWGVSQASQRGEINERRLKQVADKSALVPDFAAGKLTRLEPGATLDYYREFNAGGRKEVEEQARQFAGKYLVVSLDGQVPVTDGKRIEALSCVWEGDRTAADTDLVIPLPVKWSKVSEAALVVSAVAAAEADAPWGAAVEGVQVRLRADNPLWEGGTEPFLMMDARCMGTNQFNAPVCFRGLEVEVDGRWYGWGEPDLMAAFSATQPREDRPVPLIGAWVAADGKEPKSLVLAPGKHTVRVAFQVWPAGEPKDRLPHIVRAISNPVEIEVQDPKTGRAAPNPAPLAHAAVIKELAAKSDQIVLGQILKVHDYTARDGGMGYEVRVTKVIKGAATELPLRFRSAGWTGYARYAVDESVLLFLQSKQPAPNVPGEWGQLAPVVYLAKDPRPGGVSLWPVADYLPLLAEPRPAVPTTTAGKVELAPEEPWGEAVEGVQVRLRAEKTVWVEGDAPELKVDARCTGQNQFVATANYRQLEVEVDSRWYVWPGATNEPPGVFNAGHPRSGILLPLGRGWLPKEGNLTLTDFQLPPGKHTIRVGFTASWFAAKRKFFDVRALSNPVEIEVQGRKEGVAEAVTRTAPSARQLPGHEASLIEVAAVRHAVAVRSEATTDPNEQFGPSGVCHVEQAFRIVESLVGEPPATSVVQVVYAYLYPPHLTQRAIRKGETVIWVMEQEAGRYHGFQALADSAANRTRVCDTLTPLTPARRQALLITQLSDAPNGWRTEEAVRWALRDVRRVTAKFRGFPVAAGTPGAVACEDGKHRVETSFTLVRDKSGPAPAEWVRRLMTLIAEGYRIVELAMEDAPRAGADSTTTPGPIVAAGQADGWSEADKGLRGRLVIAQPKIAVDGWLQATLELENVGQTPLTVFTGNPMLFKASVAGPDDKPVLPTNGRDVLMSPQRVVIEDGKRLSIPVTIESLDGAKGSQVDTTTRIWKLPPGQYTLGGTYGWDAIEEMPPRGTWLGRLNLPTVPFEVVAAGAAPPAARVLEPFYRNGWHGWNPGTEVRTTFLDDKVEGWYSYVQPDLVYRLTEAALTRTQVVDGKPVVQQFDPANETGWQPAYLHKLQTAKATPTTIEIDGVKIDCLLYESTMDDIGRDVGGTTVLKEWVLAAHPSTWLRTEANKNYKVIKSLRELRQVGDRQLACVVVEERMEMSGGHQITTSWLSPEVPGHVVEKISQTWFEGRQQRSHERVAEMRSARGVSETKPGP